MAYSKIVAGGATHENKLWLAGESACPTTGKSFACKGGAGAFACQFRFRANISRQLMVR
jgi:hypothetical protein